MNARNANVCDHLNRVSLQSRSNRGLFRYRKVARSGADHANTSLPGWRLTLRKRDGAGGRVISGERLDGLYGYEALFRGARGKYVSPCSGPAFKYLGNLFGRLAGGKNHFGHAGAK